MSQTSNTGLSNRLYDIVSALGKEADFVYDTVNAYIKDAENENRTDLAELWRNIKQDKERHIQLLREALEKELHR